MDRIRLELTPEQAEVTERALDLFSRLLMGQVQEIGGLAREGLLAVRVGDGEPRRTPSPDDVDRIDDAMLGVRAVLGDYLGIGHRHVHESGKRAYEIQKALSRVVAERRNPNPEMRGTAYDGLTVRYTRDPAPVAECVRAGGLPDGRPS